MASVLMCDSCGGLTISAAAKMFLVFNPDVESRNVVSRVANHNADVAMDLCEKCVEKFVTTKPELKVITDNL